MIITGAKGHALEVLDLLLAKKVSSNTIFFFDDINNNYETIFKSYKILKNFEDIKRKNLINENFFLGVGNPYARKSLYDKFLKFGLSHSSLISNTALISERIEDLNKVDIFPFVYVGPRVEVGEGTLLNTRSNIHHGAKIGQFVEISPSANILGDVTIGNYCSVGSNATILPKIKIGDYAVIGAGSVVTRNVPSKAIVIGVPGRIIKYINSDVEG